MTDLNLEYRIGDSLLKAYRDEEKETEFLIVDIGKKGLVIRRTDKPHSSPFYMPSKYLDRYKYKTN